MKETSSETPNIDGSRFPPNAVVIDSTTSSRQTQDLDLNNNENNFNNSPNGIPDNDGGLDEKSPVINGFNSPINTTSDQFSPAMSTQVERSGPVVESSSKAEEQTTTTPPEPTKMKSIIDEIRRNGRLAVTYSWLNALLIFVPIGIIVASIDGIHGGIVFGMNAVAIIPLAGLLAFATESVAREMGDALGALLNVTFGNAVELIILYVAALLSRALRLRTNHGALACMSTRKCRFGEREREAHKGIIISIESCIISFVMFPLANLSPLNLMQHCTCQGTFLSHVLAQHDS